LPRRRGRMRGRRNREIPERLRDEAEGGDPTIEVVGMIAVGNVVVTPGRPGGRDSVAGTIGDVTAGAGIVIEGAVEEVETGVMIVAMFRVRSRSKGSWRR
jgi:hypothetical protein